jgi:hypothetical protein
LGSWVQALLLHAQACDSRVLQCFLGAKVALSQLNSKFFNIFLSVFATDFQPIPLEIGFPNGSPTGLEHWNKHLENDFLQGRQPDVPCGFNRKCLASVSNPDRKHSFAAVVYSSLANNRTDADALSVFG